MTATTTATFTEAPASCTVKFYIGDYDAMLTLRDMTGQALLAKLPALLSTLEKMGASPTYRRRDVPAAAPATANGNGHMQAPAPQAAPAGVVICPVHHAPMKARTANGEVWHSHKATDPVTGATYWCRGEVAA